MPARRALPRSVLSAVLATGFLALGMLALLAGLVAVTGLGVGGVELAIAVGIFCLGTLLIWRGLLRQSTTAEVR